MATKIRLNTSTKQVIRFKRKKRIRARVEGATEKPRLAIFRSNKHLYVQLVDDAKGHTLVSAGTNEEDLREKVGGTIEGAKTWATSSPSAPLRRTSTRSCSIAAGTFITAASRLWPMQLVKAALSFK